MSSKMKYAPMQNVVMDALIEKGYLIPPKNNIGPEGYLLIVEA